MNLFITFQPDDLQFMKQQYSLINNTGSSLNKELKELVEHVFNIIKENYDNKDYYLNESQKSYCENLTNSLFEYPDVYVETTSVISMKIAKFFPTDNSYSKEVILKLFDSNKKVNKQFISFNIVSNNYKDGKSGIFKKFIKNEKIYDFDIDWAYENMKYIEYLSLKDKLNLYGYTYNGDVYANTYLMGHEEKFDSYLNEKIYRHSEIDLANMHKHEYYFPLFYQCLDLLLNNFKDEYQRKLNIKEDIIFELRNVIFDNIPLNELRDGKSKNIEELYVFITSRLRKFSPSFYKDAVKLYVEDINRIIKNSPPTKKEMVVFRGAKDKYFYSDKSNTKFINTTFMSTSFNLNKAFDFVKGECCLKKIILKKGTRCMFMESITQVENELEILLGLNNEFRIIDNQYNSYKPSISVVKTIDDYDDQICGSRKKNMDITVMEIL